MLQLNKVNAGLDSRRHVVQTSKPPTSNSNFQFEWWVHGFGSPPFLSLFSSLHLSSIPFYFFHPFLFLFCFMLLLSLSISSSLSLLSFWFILSSARFILFHLSLSFLSHSLCLLKVMNKQTSSGWLASPIHNSSQANYSEDACQAHEIHLCITEREIKEKYLI